MKSSNKSKTAIGRFLIYYIVSSPDSIDPDSAGADEDSSEPVADSVALPHWTQAPSVSCIAPHDVHLYMYLVAYTARPMIIDLSSNNFHYENLKF